MIDISEVVEWSSKLQPGDRVRIRVPQSERSNNLGPYTTYKTTVATVKAVYPHIADTTGGTFRHIDLYIWNNGGGSK